MPREALLQALVARIHSLPELEGCIIGFQGDGQSRLLHPGSLTSNGAETVAVVIELVEETNPAYIDEMNRWAAAPGASLPSTSNPAVVTNRSRLGPELIGAGLSCGLTIVSAAGVVGGVAAEVPTGGASTFLVVASWTGLATGGIQCLNGLVRVGRIATDMDGTSLTEWDNNQVYSVTMLVVDGIGVASGMAGLGASGRNLVYVLQRQGALSARGLTPARLVAMNRAERMATVTQLVEDASRTPEGRAAILAAAREAEVNVNRLSGSGMSIEVAERMTRVITVETTRRLNASLRDVISGATGLGVSASPAELTGSGSGSLNWIINNGSLNWIINIISA